MIQPIAFKHQYSTFLNLHVNGFQEGYRTLCWYNRSTPKNVHKEYLSSPDFTINEIRKGDYIFYTQTNKEEKSQEMRLFFREDTATERLNLMTIYLDKIADSDHKNDFLSLLNTSIISNQKIPSLFVLAKMYQDMRRNTKEILPLDRECYECLVPVMENYENRILSTMNRSGFGSASLTSEPRPLLTVDPMITKVDIFRYGNGEEIFYRSISMDTSSARLDLKENEAYILYLYQDKDLAGVLHHLQLCQDSLNGLWEEFLKEQNKYDSLFADTEMIGDVDTSTLTAEERRFYAEEYHCSNDATVFPRINFAAEMNGNLYVNNQKIDMLKAFHQPIYIANKDTDFLFEDSFDTMSPVISQYMSINPRANSSYENQLFYLVDGSGNILTRAERYRIDDDLYSYKNKRNHLEKITYLKKLTNIFRNAYPETVPYLKAAASSALEDEEVAIDNIHEYLIEHILQDTTMPYGQDLSVYLILRNYLIQKKYDADMFQNHAVIYHGGIPRLSFPPLKDTPYVVVVGFYSNDAQQLSYRYYHSGDGSVDVPMQEYGVYFAYVIRESDFYVSGFFMTDTYRDRYQNNWNLNVEVK